MKPVEDMTAMEVCAVLVAREAAKLIGEEEIARLYDIHCAKLKKEIEAKNVKSVSAEFQKELLEAVKAEEAEVERRKAGEKSDQ